MTVKFHFAPKPRRTVSCAWLGCSNRNYESFAPVLWVFEDYKCEAFVGYDVLYIVSGSVPSCPCEKTWLQIRITFLKDKDKGTQSDLRRSHSRGQILLGHAYLRCLEPGALVLLDSCNAAHSCKLFSKSSLTGSLISQYPLNAENCCWTIGVWWRISHYGQWTICASSDCLWHTKTLFCLSEFGLFTVDFPITLYYYWPLKSK